MRETIFMSFRWIGVRLSIARGFLAWWAYRIIPSWRGGLWDRAGNAVLPYAGDYAFADDPWVKECRQHWIKTGQPMPAGDDQFHRALEQGGAHG